MTAAGRRAGWPGVFLLAGLSLALTPGVGYSGPLWDASESVEILRQPGMRENPNRILYGRHCGYCHGAHAEGGSVRVSGSRHLPPALTHLVTESGAALPRATLLHRVLDPRRRGAPRVCWGRHFAWASRTPATTVMRRGTVIAILQYLETIQEGL